MFGKQRVKRFMAALACLAAVHSLGGSSAAEEAAGTVRLGDGSCPPCPPYMMPQAPVYPPARPPSFAPRTPAPRPATPGQLQRPTDQPTAPGQTPSTTPTLQQPAGAAPQMATPTFTPAAATTAATAPQATAPNTIGDFFGPTCTKPIILPGEVVNQAIFVAPIIEPPELQKGVALEPVEFFSVVDYFRIVDPTGQGTYETASDVLLGTGQDGFITPASLSLLGQQLLMQYDGSTFTGDVLDLGPLTDPREFVAADSDTVGDVDLLDPEDPTESTTLFEEPIYNIHETLQVFLPAPGAAVGRPKIADNNSVFPKDRVFFNYSGFTNVPLSQTGENAHRYVPGIEMAFLQEQMSLEVRLPFAATLDTDIRADGTTNRNEVEFGNIVTTLKALLVKSHNHALTVGASLTFPTASDVTLHDLFGNELISLENNSMHAMPFLGASYFEDRWFATGWVQGDIDTTGNRVLVRSSETGNLQDVGELHESPLLYVSASLGYWLYRNGYQQTSFACENGRYIKRKVACHDRWITGLAPLAELHYNATLEEGDLVESGLFEICSNDEISLTNLVLGGLVTFGTGGSLSVAWATPIIGRNDRQFDHEVRVWIQHEL